MKSYEALKKLMVKSLPGAVLDAIWENDTKTFEILLHRNREIFAGRTEDMNTMLSVAACKGNLDIVKILLENGAEINSCDLRSKESPLHDAIIADNIETAIYLIDNGADLTIQDINRRTPLHVLANKKALGFLKKGCDPIVNKILGRGIKYDSVPIAAAFGTVRDVKMLVDSGCDIDDFLEFSQRNSLQIAAFLNNEEMLNYILSETNNINWHDYENKTALDIATNERIIALLQNAGAESHIETRRPI